MKIRGVDVTQVERRRWRATFERVARPCGMVVLAATSAQADRNPSDSRVTEVLHGCRISTLSFDPPRESRTALPGDTRELSRFVGQWLEVLAWLQAAGEADGRQVGLFGTARGGAAALQAVAQQPGSAAAVVSRSGRPDLVFPRLPLVRAATLLIVGAGDEGLLPGNRLAMRALTCRRRLEVVPGAGPMHTEPAALEAANQLAASWFMDHLVTAARP